jgi:effector-binding domain-containing protein
MTAARIAYGRSDALFLEESIRGEKAAMRDYEAALHRAQLGALPTELSSLLTEQYRSIRESFAELILTASSGRSRATRYEIRTAEMPPETILTKRVHTTLARVPAEMNATLQTIGRPVHGVPFAIYHNEPFRPNDVDVEMGVTISPDLPFALADGLVTRQLAAGTVAYTLHVGPYEAIGAAYEAIFAWLRQNGRSVSGPAREVYWVGPDDTNHPEDFRTEIEIPIT